MSGSLRLVPAALAADKHDHFDLVFAVKGRRAGLAACAILAVSAPSSGYVATRWTHPLFASTRDRTPDRRILMPNG
jgi:hypothetical protein